MLLHDKIVWYVFSAHAEVVPNGNATGIPGWRILRARGGSSVKGKLGAFKDAYSPRTRR